jgi:glycyl-tRNA synthetase beta chain
VIRLIIENKLRVSLGELFSAAGLGFRSYGWFGHLLRTGQIGDGGIRPMRSVAAELLDFFADRLKVHLREQGVRHDLVAAVFAPRRRSLLPLPQAGEGEDAGEVEDDLVRLLARVAALDAFLESEDGANLLTAYRRASNIVRIEEKKDGRSYDAVADHMLLEQGEERAVAERLAEVGRLSDAALAKEEFGVAMAALAQLRHPVDEFFRAVTVNCDDARLRENRLRLLSQIRATLNRVADFSQIEG